MYVLGLAKDFFIGKAHILATDWQQFPNTPGPGIKLTSVVDRHRYDADPDPISMLMPIQIRIRNRLGINMMPISFKHVRIYFFLLFVTALPYFICMAMIPIRIDWIRISKPQMPIPIRIRQNDADSTRSGSTTRENTGLGFRGVGDKVHMSTGTLSDRRMTCLTEEARGSSQGHPCLRQVQTENKKLLFVSYCTKNFAVPGTVPVPTYRDGRIYSTQTARNSVCLHGSMRKGTSLRAERTVRLATSSGSLLMKIFCKAGTRRQTECNLYKVF